MPEKKRSVVVYKKYFDEFFIRQRPKVRDKIIWTFGLIEQLAVVPETYLKHLEGTSGLYEIRVHQGSDIFRIFCFFDEGKIVVLMNGFQKKTPKTPKVELQLAEKLKAAYYEEKS
ncbi:type II toxin-antitoxin system RelE/ParE family toxin [Hymenobacter sp. H14-R3]|uniref:type II toxin-antitoxin system RelE/ParE family toxin n=1 Tax=Hymenobacter sp. H14-R3 TaxID=3046308 RepID=UPI0024BA31D9|nr:type II toxin-antitoxin system RelE/ParE family toxin [Hymenobacter sp. H14-R3]MDJ0366003.1 type II toxin-antitoxin system RelE/ParE family toxin [Hymenobacter sp. H14-R3]